MTIVVNTQNVTAQTVAKAETTDSSSAHVEVVLLVGTLPPIHHAFDFQEGTVTIPLADLQRGKHRCTLIVSVFKHRNSLGRSYDVVLEINGQVAATAKGSIPSGRSNDIGFGDFVLNLT